MQPELPLLTEHDTVVEIVVKEDLMAGLDEPVADLGGDGIVAAGMAEEDTRHASPPQMSGFDESASRRTYAEPGQDYVKSRAEPTMRRTLARWADQPLPGGSRRWEFPSGSADHRLDAEPAALAAASCAKRSGSWPAR